MQTYAPVDAPSAILVSAALCGRSAPDLPVRRLCRHPPSRSLHSVTYSLQYGSCQIEHSLSCDDRDLFARLPTDTSPLDRVADAVPIGGDERGDERKQITDIANAMGYSKDWQERNRK